MSDKSNPGTPLPPLNVILNHDPVSNGLLSPNDQLHKIKEEATVIQPLNSVQSVMDQDRTMDNDLDVSFAEIFWYVVN